MSTPKERYTTRRAKACLTTERDDDDDDARSFRWGVGRWRSLITDIAGAVLDLWSAWPWNNGSGWWCGRRGASIEEPENVSPATAQEEDDDDGECFWERESRYWEESRGEGEKGPKIKRSLNSDGVNGGGIGIATLSLSSGKGNRIRGGFFDLGLIMYGSNGSVVLLLPPVPSSSAIWFTYSPEKVIKRWWFFQSEIAVKTLLHGPKYKALTLFPVTLYKHITIF